MNETDRHNRQVMLQRVKTYWLVGVLQESLHGAEIIDIAMSYRASAVMQSADFALGASQLDEFDQPLPLGTSIVDVYTQTEGSLLIMGEPGAGKTTTLLQLVSNLLIEAEINETAPIPVVFGLATWQAERPFHQWMVDILSNQYEVPAKLGRQWLENGRFLPLLDGLDEVAASRRERCAQAINQFRQSHPTMATVVTCRSQDYKALATNLQLAQAIVLQPLSMAQIDDYLASVGKRLAGLRAALQGDATLRDLAQSPLMLSIMTLAYYRMPKDIAISLADRGVGQTLLFEVYVERMAQYRGGDKLYAPEDTSHWLAWLAHKMSEQNQTLFFLEGLQPNWLERRGKRPFIQKQRRLIGGGVGILTLIVAIWGWMSSGWQAAALAVLLGAITSGVTALGGLIPLKTRLSWLKIETAETLRFSWLWGVLGAAIGILMGLPTGWLMSKFATLLGLPDLPWVLLTAVFFATLVIVENALTATEMKMRTTPGQGIVRSRQNGINVAVIIGVLTAVSIGIALSIGSLLGMMINWAAVAPFWAGTAVYLGGISGLRHGGLTTIQHTLLLQMLHQKGNLPPNTIHFLDYAAERSLLRKVGGGYMFVHALLLDYFRNLE